MTSFLDQVIAECFSEEKNDFSKTCIIFPTRRAGLIFKNKLFQKKQKTFWLPKVFSISDFISSVSPLRIAERTELLLELYRVYKNFYPDVSYDKYIAWGEMMLTDFDELDKYLLNPSLVFKSIQSLKEIDATFQLGEEEIEALKNFWSNFSEKELSKTKKEFLNTWNILEPVYKKFTETISEKGFAYEGLAYRKLTDDSAKYFNLPYEKIIAAGFYALTPAEEKFFSYLDSTGKLQMFWDTDSYYVNDKMQEAGNFIRKNNLIKDNFKWLGNYFNSTKKKISVTGVSLQIGQAKALGETISDKLNTGFSEEETAIVLPDETMLNPVLHALPDSINHLNITMGYSLKQSKLFSLFLVWHKLHKTSKQSSGASIFHTATVQELVHHAFVEGNIPEEFLRNLKKYTNNFIRESEIPVGQSSFMKILFHAPQNFLEVISFFIHIVSSVKNSFLQQEEPASIDEQLVSHVLVELKEFSNLLLDYSELTTTAEAWMVLKDFLISLKIPFSGEPVKGLQVMGFLETRALDFKNIFILNLNENTLPTNSIRNSYIPFTIRKSFGLPTYEDHDAIAAYHFYRLLQRAENIFLFYDTEVKSAAGGEKSRYLLQLFYEMQNKFPEKIFVQHHVAVQSTKLNTDNEITIETTSELKQKIEKLFLTDTNGMADRSFTASSLNTFINCSLQFYFKYIERIKEQDEIEEEMDAATFGNVLHKAMQLLYLPYNGKVVLENDFEKIKLRIEESVSNAIKEKYDKHFVSKGKNYLFEKTIIELVKKILNTDADYSPFTYLESEKEYSSFLPLENGKQIHIKGFFDRTDKKENLFRIADYKTGKAEIKSTNDFEKIFSDPAYKINLQLLLYSWLAQQNKLNDKIVAGIYPLRQMADGVQYLNGKNPVSENELTEFENHLRNFISKIIYEPYFSQTNDLKKCSFCSYRTICNR